MKHFSIVFVALALVSMPAFATTERLIAQDKVELRDFNQGNEGISFPDEMQVKPQRPPCKPNYKYICERPAA